MNKIPYIIGEGNLAQAISFHFTEQNIPFKWFKKSETSTSFTSTDFESDKYYYFLAIQDDQIDSILKNISGDLNTTIIVLSGNYDLSFCRKKFPKINFVKLHPMMTFSSNVTKNNIFINSPFYYDGDLKLKTVLISEMKIKSIFEFNISSQTAYHLLGVFASNFQVALMKILRDLADENQIDHTELSKFIIPIMRQTMNNLSSNPKLIDVLSGPVKRDDAETIKSHKIYLKNFNKNYESIYNLLTEELKKIKDSD